MTEEQLVNELNPLIGRRIRFERGGISYSITVEAVRPLLPEEADHTGYTVALCCGSGKVVLPPERVKRVVHTPSMCTIHGNTVTVSLSILDAQERGA